MYGKSKGILCIFTVLALLLSMLNITVSADDKEVLAKFSFEQKNSADNSLNVTYGGSASDGYGATSGIFTDNSRLYASITGEGLKKIEWSNYDGADGNAYTGSDGEAIGAVPVMAAGSKNMWGDAQVSPAYFMAVTSTVGYSNITFSADLGGSKKGAKNFLLAYSTDGTNFTNVSDTVYSISKNKTLENAIANIPLPESTYNSDKLYLKIYTADNTAISGGLLSDNPSGGENAVNNVCVKGTPIDGKTVWQPTFDIVKAELSGNTLSVTAKNVSEDKSSCVNIVCLYDSSELKKILTADMNDVAANKKCTLTYDVTDVEFDNIKVFEWNSLSNVAPMNKTVSFEKDNITVTPTPTVAPTETPQQYSNEPAYKDIPRVDITGDITDISRENAKDVTLSYTSSTESFTSYATIKWQGRSSVTQGYPKYNYALKLFKDEERQTKDKHQFKTWLESNNYCLKANWMDSTHARNIVNARLAASIQKELLPTGVSGLIDGFPIHVYLNGEDQGIYTWNIPKKGWTFNMDSDNPNHIIFGGEQQKGACLFENESENDNDWEMVYPDTSDTARDKLNRLINFVKDSSVEEFKEHFDEYLNFDSVVNYYVFAHIICHTDGYAKNMLLVTFDGNIWYTSLYDMDSTWGLHWRGNKIIGADALYNPQNKEGTLYSTSLLWSKFEQAFGDEIYQRYTELRNNELTDEKIIAAYEYFIDGIGQDLYDLDEKVWENKSYKHPYIPSRDYRLDQIKQFMQERQTYTDEWMENLRTTK